MALCAGGTVPAEFCWAGLCGAGLSKEPESAAFTGGIAACCAFAPIEGGWPSCISAIPSAVMALLGTYGTTTPVLATSRSKNSTLVSRFCMPKCAFTTSRFTSVPSASSAATRCSSSASLAASLFAQEASGSVISSKAATKGLRQGYTRLLKGNMGIYGFLYGGLHAMGLSKGCYLLEYGPAGGFFQALFSALNTMCAASRPDFAPRTYAMSPSSSVAEGSILINVSVPRRIPATLTP